MNMTTEWAALPPGTGVGAGPPRGADGVGARRVADGAGALRGGGVGPPRGAARPVGPPRQAGADESVLTSKMTVPALPGWAVRRERIDRMIEDGARGPLTVVTGPPGAGKTMSLAWWAATRRRPGPVAWVTFDPFDDRPEIVWSYIAESLRRAGVVLPAELSLAGGQPAGHGFLHQLASALAVQDPAVALVLDDIHLLTDPAALDGLAYVLRNASEGLRVLVAARSDPMLPLHRYRLTGELTEVRAADLAFTVREARMMLAQHDVNLPPEPLEALTRKNEGWAAGLRLAAMAMEKHRDPARYAAGFGAEDNAVAGYFVEEVLNAQQPEVRDVLLKTSILDRVSPALAGELAGDGDAGQAIGRLAEANVFVDPVGSGWYRYHPLFAEVLRLKLRQERPHQVPGLHRQAASWLRRNGMLADAVGQAAAAGEWQLAARMAVEDLAVSGLMDPRASLTMAEAFRRMPAIGERAEPPAFIVAAAMLLRGFDHQAGEQWLYRAEQALARLPAEDEVPSRLR
jgi:LuxR family transcriptional regulator, maltose regulon positive regulatory protein